MKNFLALCLCVALSCGVAARETDVDRNMVQIDNASLMVNVDPKCAITDDEAKNTLYLRLKSHHLEIADESLSAQLILIIECFSLNKTGPLFAAHLTLRIEAITVFDYVNKKAYSIDGLGPPFSELVLWQGVEYGIAKKGEGRELQEAAIKALADSYVVRRIKAAERVIKSNNSVDRQKPSAKQFLDAIDAEK